METYALSGSDSAGKPHAFSAGTAQTIRTSESSCCELPVMIMVVLCLSLKEKLNMLKKEQLSCQ